MMSAMRWLVIGVVALVAGCKSGSDDPQKIIAKYKADVLARGADFAAITKMLDGHDLVDPAPIDPPAVFWGDNKHQRNAMVIDAGELLHDWWHGDTKDKPELTFGQLFWWRESIDIVTSGQPGTHQPLDLEAQLRDLANFRYLLVLVTTDFVMPKLGSGPNEFMRGRWAGDALLFDLRAHKYLGGWEVAGESSFNVTAYGSSPSSSVITDLALAVGRRIDETIVLKLPTSIPPHGL